jgi:DNA mismatch repair ATPase MutS
MLILASLSILSFTIASVPLMVNLLITAIKIKSTNQIHNTLSGKYRLISSFGKMIEEVESSPFQSDVLAGMRSELISGQWCASDELRRLGKILGAFDSRMNILAGFFLNAIILWDMQCINRLKKWSKHNGSHTGTWLRILGEFDAFSSLANYRYNNPDFVFPALSEGSEIFDADGLGHPLIPERKRVCNSFRIEQEKICIISGANMAGKSTFLRTVAVNYILAMSGAPVCAGRMKFTPMKIFTSMRTTDSLKSGESYFYAELRRLKELENEVRSSNKVFFILDEILKGTNSEDKSTGSKLFVSKLASMGANGIIATHDTALGLMENTYPGKIFNRCIEIDIEGEKIFFNYLLRDGITTSRNAVLLMKQMGII